MPRIMRAAKAAIFCSLLLIAVDRGFGQSGPPPFPPMPVNALVAYPLDAPPWKDWYGDPARGFTNLNVVGSWDENGGPALSVDANVLAYLNYDVYQDGYTNIVFNSGSISLWCQANWTSTTDGGTGPTNWAVLFSVGNWSSNAAQSAWTLAISPDGTNLVMEAQSAGSNQTVFNVPIDFDAGDWHSVTVTYSSSNCCLYLEGQFVTNTEMISNIPGSSDCTNYGMFVGSLSTAGICQFHGQFQWFDTYDYPLSADAVASDYAEVSSYLAYYGGSLPPVRATGGFHPAYDGPPDFGGDGGSTNGGGSPDFALYTPFSPPAAISPIDYAAYYDFYLSITNNASNSYVSVCNCLSNITYEILTNANLSNSNGWQVWQTLLATNSITPAPPIALATTNALYFKGLMVWSSCTNYSPPVPDWWAMLYFNSTACVNPAANPSGDGIDNWDKYLLGLNPNVTYASQLFIAPPGGNYVSTPPISIFSLSGASIKYTTNGSIPSATNGLTASSGVPLTNLPGGNFTLKAWESGLVSNVPAIASYTIIPATPVFSIGGGMYGYGTTLQIRTVTTNAVVRYTTNGSTPTTNSTQIQPTNIITLVSNETIEAAAWLGTNMSPVAQAEYVISPALTGLAPTNDNFSNAITLSGASGSFSGTTVGATVEAFETNNYDDYFWPAATSGNTVWYKWTAPSNGNVFLDCSKCDPSELYYFYPVVYDFPATNGPNPTNLVPAGYVDLGGGAYGSYGYDYELGPNYYQNDDTSYTLVATNGVTYYFCICYLYNEPASFDVSWKYVGPSQTPVFSPPGGSYSMPESVEVSDSDTDVVIHYTLTGLDPTTNDTAIPLGGTVIITNNTTLKAAAWRPGLSESAVQTAVFTATTNPTTTVSAPVLSPTNVIFTNSVTITLTCTNTGATIYYTLNGTTPDRASTSMASGGTVTINNSAILSATAWVTNLNFSPVTSSQYAKLGSYTAGDGIPDSSKLQLGINILISDAGNVNPSPFAHGLDNLQVYDNPSVLLANNYSTLNDGIPDWWLVQNGYSVSTPASALGANGQTLLTSYLAGLSPNNASSQPGQLPPIDFHMVHGPANSMVMVLDNVRPDVVDYFLYCTDADPGSPYYNQTFLEEFPANTAMAVSGQQWGRYFQMTNMLPSGNWIFTLQGVNSNALWSTTSSNTFRTYAEYLNGNETDYWSLYIGQPVPVVGYTNNNAIREADLAQILRAESDTWVYYAGYDDYWGGVFGWGTFIYDNTLQQPITTETSWGTLTFQFDATDQSYSPTGLASYFTSICSTPDVSGGCDSYYQYAYYYGYGYYDSSGGLTPLQLQYDNNGNPWFVMPDDSWGAGYRFNPAGLEYLSVTYRIGEGDPITLDPGQSNAIPNTNFNFEAALQTETPTFQTINYYFDGREYPVGEWDGPALRSLPAALPPTWGDGWQSDGWNDTFPVSVTNPVIVAQVGRPVNLQSWSQVMPVRPNGSVLTNEPCWLDQDFAQAYLCNPATGDVPRTTATNYNGKFKIDTNAAVSTGILSPNLNYSNNNWQFPTRGANFTPTQTGKVIVTTQADPSGNYGEVTIYVLDIQVDANHDGLMDNRDLTSISNPFQFWVNDNFDRYTNDVPDGVWYDDDVSSGDSPGTPGVPTPDYNYRAGDGTPCIPTVRDLQDYTRLWIPGLSNMVHNLPTNYTVTLQWRNNTGAAIRLFKASETNGGTNYLFDQTEGGIQTLFDSYPCYGNVSPSQTISLDQAFASTTVPKPTDYFIFCGAAAGNDELVCQVRNPYGGVVGEASVFLNLKEIKQMYERWTVGDDPSTSPNNIAVPAYDNGSGSFQYPYDSSVNAATPYILYVHGWNMPSWEKDRFAESAYKRLYWQGYQGRFGIFRWPTDFGFEGNWSALTDPRNYDNSEFQAWKSATGLRNKLIALNIQYPGKVYLLAHSMGNVVAGEALRLTGTTNLVNTYVASQAAITSHTYDSTITNLLQFTYTYPTEPLHTLYGNKNYGPQTPNIYGNWFAGNYGGGVSKLVNFYNANDYALAMPRWGFDQIMKPDNLFSGDYVYGGSPNDPAPWNHFGFATISGTNFFDIVNSVTDRYQVMAYDAEARAVATGATPVNTVGGSVDLTQLWQTDPSGHSFSDHFWHSAEFRGDPAPQQSYWNTLLGRNAFNLK